MPSSSPCLVQFYVQAQNEGWQCEDTVVTVDEDAWAEVVAEATGTPRAPLLLAPLAVAPATSQPQATDARTPAALLDAPLDELRAEVSSTTSFQRVLLFTTPPPLPRLKVLRRAGDSFEAFAHRFAAVAAVTAQEGGGEGAWPAIEAELAALDAKGWRVRDAGCMLLHQVMRETALAYISLNENGETSDACLPSWIDFSRKIRADGRGRAWRGSLDRVPPTLSGGVGVADGSSLGRARHTHPARRRQQHGDVAAAGRGPDASREGPRRGWAW